MQTCKIYESPPVRFNTLSRSCDISYTLFTRSKIIQIVIWIKNFFPCKHSIWIAI